MMLTTLVHYKVSNVIWIVILYLIVGLRFSFLSRIYAVLSHTHVRRANTSLESHGLVSNLKSSVNMIFCSTCENAKNCVDNCSTSTSRSSYLCAYCLSEIRNMPRVHRHTRNDDHEQCNDAQYSECELRVFITSDEFSISDDRRE